MLIKSYGWHHRSEQEIRYLFPLSKLVHCIYPETKSLELEEAPLRFAKGGIIRGGLSGHVNYRPPTAHHLSDSETHFLYNIPQHSYMTRVLTSRGGRIVIPYRYAEQMHLGEKLQACQAQEVENKAWVACSQRFFAASNRNSTKFSYLRSCLPHNIHHGAIFSA